MSLDGYDVIRELGRGGMAVVHLARQRDLGRLVALKELGRFNADDPAFAERFLRESRTIGSLNHPNIVTVYDYFEDSGTPYIAMELVEGGSLRPLIGEMTLPKVARVVEDALAAIGHAANAGIVHRDLKPENALITKDGRVKVADFGIAKAAESGQRGLTSEGMTVGTPEYMSPEQALAKDVGPRSDLYAIGCMTFEMLTGRLPFTDTAQGALLVKQVSEPVPDVREIDPLIPEPVAEWVAKMAEKDPDDRYQDAGEAWEALEEILLELIGPLWRRDAVLEPASAIDVSQIPPQTDVPLRPRGTGDQQAAKSSGSMTGYQTYHAPAALHEVLGTPSDAMPSVLTPTPQQRVSRPMPRATPPPQRLPTGPQPVAKPADAEDDEPKVKKVPVVPIVLAAVVVGVLAFVFGMSSGGSAAAAPVSGDGFVLTAPEGWTKGDASVVLGLGSKAVAVAPPGAKGEGVAANLMRTADAIALARGSGDPTPVKLGAGDAVSYADESGAALFLLPTSAGTLVIGCTAGPAVRGEPCTSVAGAAELTRGKAVAPGPTDEGASTLGGTLTRLKGAIKNPQEDLDNAGSASAQATAAGDLSSAYDKAATEVRDLQLGALANGPRDQLANALGSVSRGWAAFAKAADARDGGGVKSASSAISGARARVRRARTALAAVGYSVGGAG